ncbi:MAG: pseudouridine synthase [Lachnospiraceae bacterium]|nr:pseudouridine synthase [Lachnospiraceae bacterium]
MKQGFVKQKSSGEIRLNKYLSDAGVCSRREADRMIEAGAVTVDGVAAVQGMKIRPEQHVFVKGKEVAREQEMILLAVNKPRGIVCTTDTRWDDRTIYDLLNYPKRIFSVGRLDKESEGLLLMTNNGDILNKIMRAGNYHEKEYLVTVDKEITPEFLKKMAEGVYLRELEVKTRPCRVELAGEKRFRIVLTQGLNRQIRRMCETLHYKVTRLVRVRIMNIELGDLRPGEYRSITRAEWASLQAQLKHSENPGSSRKKNQNFERNREIR